MWCPRNQAAECRRGSLTPYSALDCGCRQSAPAGTRTRAARLKRLGVARARTHQFSRAIHRDPGTLDLASALLHPPPQQLARRSADTKRLASSGGDRLPGHSHAASVHAEGQCCGIFRRAHPADALDRARHAHSRHSGETPTRRTLIPRSNLLATQTYRQLHHLTRASSVPHERRKSPPTSAVTPVTPIASDSTPELRLHCIWENPARPRSAAHCARRPGSVRGLAGPADL